MPLPEPLRGDTWTNKTARQMMPLLVWCARHGKKITYGQLDAEIVRRGWGHHVHAVAYGNPAGVVGDALMDTEGDVGEAIPPLNALIVNAKTGIPGSGCNYYLSRYITDKASVTLTDKQQESMAEETIEEVWRFQKWNNILSSYELAPIKDGIPSLVVRAEARRPRKHGWSSEPESLEHIALKTWVAANPCVLQSDIRFGKGKPEYLFASADRADVLFVHELGSLAVEVKAENSNDADLERGIYQCVKYQALLRAEMKAEHKIPNGHSVLVSERALPPDLQKVAALLGVRVIIANRRRLGKIKP